MKKEAIEHLKVKLTKIKDAIESESVHTVNDMKNESTLYPDPTDRASLETDRNTELRLRDRERKQLNKINKVLKKFDDGSYGLCEECGEYIDFNRLDVRPFTTYCIDCKEDLEKQEKAAGMS